ncbi:MAG: hypothetical protein VKN60_11980 [Cyanobacteriota bacterium]|nr:hypothetical protein [Cyanobacteriota bacterium]
MTFAKVIIEKINIVTFVIIGWVFAVFQSGFAVDLILEGLKRANLLT